MNLLGRLLLYAWLGLSAIATRADAQTTTVQRQRATVPNVVGLRLDSARIVLDRARLIMRVTTRPQGVELRKDPTDLI